MFLFAFVNTDVILCVICLFIALKCYLVQTLYIVSFPYYEFKQKNN